MHKGEQIVALPSTNGFICLACNGCTRGEKFQTPNIATSARFALPINGHMSQFPSCATCSLHDLAINDHTSTYSCTDREIDHILGPTSRAKQVFPPCSCICVILNPYWDMKMINEQVTQGNALPL